MADRIFAGVTLLLVFVYAWVAYTGIKAPFQYDPLGPESWPRILSVVAGLCCLYIFLKPDTISFNVSQRTALNLAAMVGLLIIYAYFFQSLGFILSTAIFCTFASRLLGATWPAALLFGISTGVLGYLVGVKLLALNLPAGTALAKIV